MIREMIWMLLRCLRGWRGALRNGCAHVAGWLRFWTRYRRFKAIAPPDRQPTVARLYPCIGDDMAVTPVDATYFYQDAWAFRKIAAARPAWHLDVGSHHKFVSLLATVLPVTMVDVRPLPYPLDGLKSIQGSILSLPFADASVPSISSLCVVEHIGLGRYGDELDPRGPEKALAELMRVLQPGGDLYISAPVDDKTVVCYDAHTVLAEGYLLDLLKPFQVEDVRYIQRRRFRDKRDGGFATLCLHLKRPSAAGEEGQTNER